MENLIFDFFLFFVIVPNIWDYHEEEEEIKDEILHDFEQMKVFYKKVLEAKGHVLVSIC